MAITRVKYAPLSGEENHAMTFRSARSIIAPVFLSMLLAILSGCDQDRNDEPGSTVRKPADKKGPAATVSEQPPSECRWTESPITIDGIADEPAWKNAQVIDNFYLPWLQDKARPSKTKTSAK